MALTFDDILSKSSPLEFVSDVVYQDTADVDVIGLKLFSKEIGNRKAVLYKDAEFKRPLKDMELLSLFFMNTSSYEISDNVVTNIVGPLKRLSYMQYKDGNFTRNFFVGSGLNQFISGETYDAICEHLGNDDEPEPSKALLFDGEVTTVGAPFAGTTIDLQGDLPKSDIHVTFNGQDYTLPYNNNGQFAYYGESGDEGPIFVNFPLLINLVEGICHVFTENAGTYSLKIWGEEDESPTTPVDNDSQHEPLA